MKKIVYRNIEISRGAMQKVLTEWLKLGLGPCMGLNDLVLHPRSIYDRAIKGQDQLVLPDPSGLYETCKQALQLPYCAMYGIFIVNDDKVEINEETVEELINRQNMKQKDSQVKHRSAGRPFAIIDWNKVGSFLQAQCDSTAIANILGISVDTLYNRCPKDNNLDYSVWAAQKKSEGLELLREKQFNTAMAGDKTMLIWLGKQLLGQKEQVEQTIRLPELKLQPMNQVEADKIQESLKQLNEINNDIPAQP